MRCSQYSAQTTTRSAAPRLSGYGGDLMIAGRSVPYGTGDLPEDFADRLDRLKRSSGLTWDEFAEVLGVERKQALRWRRGTTPSGGAFHSLVNLAAWIPGGLDILMGENFLKPLLED